MDQVSGSRRDHFSHFVSRRWHINDSSGLGRCYLVLSIPYESLEKINLSLRSFETGNLSADNFKKYST